MATQSNIIIDERLEPYFIKIINSSYEVHKKHTPKDDSKKQYTKFICSRTTIESAVGVIVKAKLTATRRTKKTILLKEYLTDLKSINKLLEEVIGEDSLFARVRKLEARVAELEKPSSKLLDNITF